MQGRGIILFLIFVFSLFSFDVPTKSDLKKLKAAYKAFMRSDYLKSFNLYGEYLKNDPSNAHALYYSGLCLLNIDKSDTTAIKYFKAAEPEFIEAHYYIGRIFQVRGESRKALEEYYSSSLKPSAISKDEIADKIKQCEKAIEEESQKEYFVVKNLGTGINSKHPDYVPLIWNENLVFTSRRENAVNQQVDAYGKYYEDIYIAAKIAGGWAEPKPISNVLNTSDHDACVAISPSGNEMIIYRTDESKTSGDLYITQYEGGVWSVPVKMGNGINSDALEASACFSAFGNEIVFSSDREGGYGGKDLYRIVRFLNGTYSLPHNLGDVINTPQDDDAPFIQNDNNTLYFSSKGHGSMGEYDIYSAQFNRETSVWDNVVNMGQPVNSSNDDIYFFKKTENNSAYFSSGRSGGLGGMDIYEVLFSESVMVIGYLRLDPGNIDRTQLQDLQVFISEPLTNVLVGLYTPNKDHLGTILLMEKKKEYEIRVEGSNIKTITRKVIFDEKNKEITLNCEINK